MGRHTPTVGMSPPTRVEWIEIAIVNVTQVARKSPPTRVEWIEIKGLMVSLNRMEVSAHTGEVD